MKLALPRIHQLITSLLFLIGLSSLLGQFLRVSSPWGMVSVYELLMGVTLPILLFSLFSRQSVRVYPSMSWLRQPVFWLALFLGWLALRTGMSHASLNAWAYVGRLVLYAVWATILALWAQHDIRKKVVLKQWVMWWLFGQAVLALAQYLFFPDTRLLWYLGWDDHFNRALGTLLDPGFLGALMGLGVVIGTQKLSDGKKEQWAARLFLLAPLITLALTYSRTSYGAAIAGIIVWVGISARWKTGLTVLGLLILSFVLVPHEASGEGQKLLRTESITARQTTLQGQLTQLTPSTLLIGKGWHLQAQQPQTPTAQFNASMADSAYMQIVLSSGVLGLIFFLLMLASAAWQQRMNAEVLGVFAVVSVHSLVSPTWLYSWVLLVLGVWWASFLSPNEVE